MQESVQSGMPSDPAILQVLDRFGLRAVESVSQISVGTGSQESFRVRADGSDWVIKRYWQDTDLRRVSTAHEFELRLLEVGFPVAPLQRSTSGQTLLAHGDAHYALHGWVHGRQLTITDRNPLLAREPRLAGDLGAMVGTLHRVSSEGDEHVEEEPDGDPDHLLRAPLYAVRTLRRPRRRPPLVSRWQELRLRRHKNDYEQWMLQIVPEVVSHARRIARRSIAHDLEPTDIGLIHHDLNWENLVFDEQLHLRAVLDFDNSMRAPWVLEVGSAAVALVGTTPAAVDRFLAGYQSVSPFSVDPGLVRLAMEMKCVQSILNSVLTYLDGDTDVTLREAWCRELYASVTTLTENDNPERAADRLSKSADGERLRATEGENHDGG